MSPSKPHRHHSVNYGWNLTKLLQCQQINGVGDLIFGLGFSMILLLWIHRLPPRFSYLTSTLYIQYFIRCNKQRSAYAILVPLMQYWGLTNQLQKCGLKRLRIRGEAVLNLKIGLHTCNSQSDPFVSEIICRSGARSGSENNIWFRSGPALHEILWFVFHNFLASFNNRQGQGPEFQKFC